MVGSMVMFMSSEPYRSVPSWAGSSQDVPARAASQPRMRSSSMAGRGGGEGGQEAAFGRERDREGVDYRRRGPAARGRPDRDEVNLRRGDGGAGGGDAGGGGAGGLGRRVCEIAHRIEAPTRSDQ